MKMFKMIFLLLLLSSISYAQLTGDCGFKFGLTISEQEFDKKDTFYDESKFAKRGFMAGIYLESQPYGPFSLTSELNYVQKGSRDKYVRTNNEGNPTSHFYLNNIWEYVQLNFALKSGKEINEIPVYLFAGPSVNYLITTSGIFDAFVEDHEINFGYIAGGGINLQKLLKKPISLEVVYNPDLSNTYENDHWSIKHNTWQIRLSFGYK